MFVTMPSSATTTQTFSILTDVQLAHPTIVCPITVTLTPQAAYISISADFSTISVDASQIVQPADYGAHSIKLTVNSANFPGSVAQKIFSFTLTVLSCANTVFSA